MMCGGVSSSMKKRRSIRSEIGLNEKDYSTYRGWEEANIEALQRLMRPSILARLGVLIGESGVYRN